MQQIAQQGSKEWFMLRLGMFTNSELWKLMIQPEKITEESPLSVGAKTYIAEIFWDYANGYPKNVDAYSLKYGRDHEPEAKQLMVNSINLKSKEWHTDGEKALVTSEFIIHPKIKYWGGSPESKPIIIDCIGHSTEIKCPSSGKSHDENIQMCKSYLSEFDDTHWMDTSILKKYPELFWQMQAHMELQNTQKCLFASYHKSKRVLPESLKDTVIPDEMKDEFMKLNGIPFIKDEYYECIFSRLDDAIQLLKLQLKKAFLELVKYAQKYGIDWYKEMGMVRDILPDTPVVNDVIPQPIYEVVTIVTAPDPHINKKNAELFKKIDAISLLPGGIDAQHAAIYDIYEKELSRFLKAGENYDAEFAAYVKAKGTEMGWRFGPYKQKRDIEPIIK